MKTKYLIILFVIVIFSSCSSSKILPKPDEIVSNAYGGLIELKTRQGYIYGELISVNDEDLSVLIMNKNECENINKSKITSYKIYFAEANKYGWTIPAFTILSFTHGWLSILSLPTNLISTIVITSSAKSSFRISSRKIKYEELKMYARFPQGLPSNIKTEEIKHNF
jgi:hypothetical protein